MISNRRGARRSAAPVERLREFSINTSKGVDISQSPVNSTTAAYVKNLIVNPDGSLSLRKPLKHVRTAGIGETYFTMFDGNILVWKASRVDDKLSTSLSVIDSATSTPIDLRLMYYTYKELPVEFPKANALTDLIASPTIKVFSTSTSTIIANAEISTQYANEEVSTSDLIANALYPSGTSSVPRYVRIEKATNEYRATVITPTTVELTTGEESVELNPNLLADNPYALRDERLRGTAFLKGIVGYVYSSSAEAVTIAKPTLESNLQSTYDATIPLARMSAVAEVSQKYTYVSCSKKWHVPTGSVLDISCILELTREAGEEEAPIRCSINATSTSAADKYSVAGSFTMRVSLQTHAGTYNEYIQADFGNDNSYKDGEKFPISATLTGASENLVERINTASQCELYIMNDDSLKFKVHSAYTPAQLGNLPVPKTSAELTMSVLPERYRPVASISPHHLGMFLKAFGNLPYAVSTVTYATWYSSTDGVTWVPELIMPTGHTNARFVVHPETSTLPPTWYVSFSNYTSAFDTLTDLQNTFKGRPDILYIHEIKPWYMFRVVTLKPLETRQVLTDPPTADYAEDTLISEIKYYTPFGDVDRAADLEFGSAVYGKKLYHKKRIFSYGHEKFFNNIFVSDIDNFDTPLYNVIDLDAKASDKVTTLVPWRNYLVSATPNAIYLHTSQDNGYLTKTVTTSLGIPEADSRCCVPILNGILIKSGYKLYLVYPNAYAGADDMLNVAPISQPVDEYLEEFENSDCKCKERFAFSTESEYILMLASEKKTLCVRYNYTTRTWNMCEYPVRIVDYDVRSVEDILLYSRGVSDNGPFTEYKFDADLGVYADQISATESVPIEFEWDSGQKTDNISTRKQFTESKIVFATQDEDENFPMELIVAVDGDPNITRIDVRSDAPTLKTDTSVGRLNTQLRMDVDVEISGRASNGLIRQLVVRYSGRGRSVRHVLKGVARSPFKMYETYVRYKLIDNKR